VLFGKLFSGLAQPCRYFVIASLKQSASLVSPLKNLTDPEFATGS
jgi:hypothetical protein